MARTLLLACVTMFAAALSMTGLQACSADGRSAVGEDRSSSAAIPSDPVVSEDLSPLLSGASEGFDAELAMFCARLCEAANHESSDEVAAFLASHGLGTVSAKHYGASSAFALARGSVDQDGSTVPLLVVVCRETQTTAEKVGDYFKGTPREFLSREVHGNVFDFEEEVWSGLTSYVAQNPDLASAGRLKVLVTGHSLGGAAANMVGARMTAGDLGDVGLAAPPGKSDVYVYTFGAIKVLTSDASAGTGFENIHNVYNRLDSFGPEGNWSDEGVSHPEAKFGHTDLYELDFGEEGWLIWDRTTNNHNIGNYIEALERGLVGCSSAAQGAGSEASSAAAQVDGTSTPTDARQDPVDPVVADDGVSGPSEDNTLCGTYVDSTGQRFTFTADGHVTMDAVIGVGEGTYAIDGDRIVMRYTLEVLGMSLGDEEYVWDQPFARTGDSIYIAGSEFVPA